MCLRRWRRSAIPTRLRTLLDTGIAISSELSLDAVLEKTVEAAATVTVTYDVGATIVAAVSG